MNKESSIGCILGVLMVAVLCFLAGYHCGKRTATKHPSNLLPNISTDTVSREAVDSTYNIMIYQGKVMTYKGKIILY